MKGVIVIDAEKCLGCRSCQLQCALEHSRSQNLHEAINEYPAPRSRIAVVAIDDLAAPLQCRHCEDAPCVQVCPSQALSKPEENGPVMLDGGRCIGCSLCVAVCPFGVIAMDGAAGAVIKCDFCLGRLEEDRLPACVEGCPTNALQFKRLEEVAPENRKKYLAGITLECEEGH